MHLGREAHRPLPPLTLKPEPQNSKSRSHTREEDFLAGASCFQTSGQECSITLPMNNHLETWPLLSPVVRKWVRRMMYMQNPEVVSDSKIKNILNTLAAFADEQREVHVRLAGHNQNIYLDLGNLAWEQLEITPNGWSVIQNHRSPVRFIRPRGLLPLPYPQPGGSMEPLRECLNLARHDHEWIMLASWVIGTFQPDGPFPILFLYGEQGSAKSTATTLLRTLVDPSKLPLRTLSSSARDLAIAASACWCVGFDNVSNISLPLSDALCRLATGGGLATRQLYTDRDEVQFTWKRPIIMNGITNFAERHDLSDRGIVINMPTIPKEVRRTERDIRRQWGEAMPCPWNGNSGVPV